MTASVPITPSPDVASIQPPAAEAEGVAATGAAPARSQHEPTTGVAGHGTSMGTSAVDEFADKVTDDAGMLHRVQQAAWTLVWLAILSAGLVYSGSWSAGPWAVAGALFLVVSAIAGTALVWIEPRWLKSSLQLAGMAMAATAALITQGTDIHLRHYVTTDSSAFNQLAARLLWEGHNPYTSSMAPASQLFAHASSSWTYRLDGGHALGVSYPAGSFLLQVPLQALGVHHMTSDWLDLAAWILTAGLVFFMLPTALRWVSPMLLLTGIYLGGFANGGTDALFLPFLVIAVWRWDRYPGRAVAWLPAWVGPAALGVACSIKQSPWFCVPFLVAGVTLVARRQGVRPFGVATRYLSVVVAAFLVVNLPFVVAAPGAWLRGVLLPMVDPLVPDGQGVVALATHGITGGVVPMWLSLAGALAACALLVAFVAWPARLHRAWLFVLPLPLALPARSLSNYLLDLAPAAIVAAISVGPWEATDEAGMSMRPRASSTRWRLAGAIVLGLGAAAAVATVLGVTSAPLRVAVGPIRAAGDPSSPNPMKWRTVVVSVTNDAGAPLHPRFMIASGGGHPGGFWGADLRRGQDPIPAGATSVFALHPTTTTWTPTHGQGWLVLAYTTAPSAVSTSGRQVWQLGKALQ